MTRITNALAFFVALFTIAAPAQAYVGPGMGLGAIGAVLGAIGAIVLAILGLVWYPVKRALKRRKAGGEA
ncbi:MAG: hypothetical protein V2J26_04605 [Pacificimonas sp.]|nr:hypothetical protein [Pacificimonas sp.]